jgi:hypothetical protein
MDDISALRQLDAKVENAASWLFAPAPAYRVRMPEFTGTPMPKDEPMAANPALGAYLDYTLKTAANKLVKLDIFDFTGALVRHYSSADASLPMDPAKLEIAPEWVEQPGRLSSTAGMHRFVWSLHYAAQAKSDKPDPWTNGVWAPPGEYRVVLDVDGVKHEQALRVLPDPRVHLPDSAYAEQFALARAIEQQNARVDAATHEAQTVLDAIVSKRPHAGNDLAAAIDVLEEQLHALNGTRAAANPHNAWAYPPRDTRNFAFIAAALAKLERAVDGADAAPSPDARAGFKALQPMVDATLKAWADWKTRELPALNAKLKAAGEEPVKIE